MSTQIPSNPSAQSVALLLPKLNDVDPDYRFMSLNDLFQVLTIGKHDFLHNDFNTAARAVDGIIKTLDDQNGEIQNLALKCLAPLAVKVPPSILPPLIEKLSTLTTQNSVDSSIPTMALRTIVVTLPRPVSGVVPTKEITDAYSAISRVLIPRLVGQLTSAKTQGSSLPNLPHGTLNLDKTIKIDPEAIDVLTEIIRCFGPMLQKSEVEVLQVLLVKILEADWVSSVVQKRIIVALSILAIYIDDEKINGLILQLLTNLQKDKIKLTQRKLFITVFGSIARSIPSRFGVYLKSVVPFVLAAVSEQELSEQLENSMESGEPNPELDDVREAALITLDTFLSSCGSEMHGYTFDVIDALLRFLKYDPNYNDDEDEEMALGESDDDENDFDDDDDDEFEADADFDNDDDSSWKIRRCSAKALYTLISTRASEDLLNNGKIYSKITSALVQRFSEREENVRLEVIATVTSLIRKTGETSFVNFPIENEFYSVNNVSQSRKRRRESSSNSLFDTKALNSVSTGLTSPIFEPTPASGTRADLAKLIPAIIRASTRLLKKKSIPTSQALIRLLDDMVLVQNGGLSEYFGQLVDPIVEAIKTTSSSTGSSVIISGTTSATANTLRISALRLIGSIASTHSSSVLHPYLKKIVLGVIEAVNEKYYKISSEAIGTAEQLVKALTPPRSMQNTQKEQPELYQLYQAIINRVAANDADLEVRQQAVQALGILLARTVTHNGSTLLTPEEYNLALNLLCDRLKNETTRLAAVNAINTIAALAGKTNQLRPDWIKEVSLELSAQFRKSNRSLRGASLGALKSLIAIPSASLALDMTSIETLVNAVLPLLLPADIQLLGPAIVLLASFVDMNPKLVVKEPLNLALCEIIRTEIGGAVLEALITLVANVGKNGVGQNLMSCLLNDVNKNGNPAIAGKVIGTLLVYGGPTVGVQIETFQAQIVNPNTDEYRRCLALAVLGEAGLRLGKESNLTPATFTTLFLTESDKVRLASAIALGRVGAGNVSEYLPEILKNMNNDANIQYLLLHSIKEIIQLASNNKAEIGDFTHLIWDQLIRASQTEENKAIGVECIGRLAIIDPEKYIPELQSYLTNPKASVRAMTIQAIRYTLVDGDHLFDKVLANSLVQIISTMLRDPEIENRRLALSTLNSAAHNKPALIGPSLSDLLPFVIHESVIKPELIREVPMGPFKHKIDDGLEIRKAAYETLYALMEISFPRLSILNFYDRILAGIKDQHDIRALCSLMLTKLIALDPEETARRLDSIAEVFRSVLSVKLKDSAVKQEIERQEEAIRSALRVTLSLHSNIPSASAALGSVNSNQGWRTYWEWVEKDFKAQLKEIREESATSER
ncbi:Cullin-associated NEDD8-dissociated protein 1, C-terminal part [Podosphaera aphanis]|nr:Cullin-associated NEDD8-dissociated protein 1, C-terminal part [Podosphaera aphanis]